MAAREPDALPRPLLSDGEAFDALLERLRNRASDDEGDAVRLQAAAIVESVRIGGDQALVEASRRFDASGVASVLDLRFRPEPEQRGGEQVGQEFCDAVERSIDAVTRFHEPQGQWVRSGAYTVDEQGISVEERVFPLRRVGLYVPGGRFPYPSTVIMSVVPAQVAGVEEIVVATPPRAIEQSAELRYVLSRLAVREVWAMGGAHGVAALAYGTESVAAVDFIAGPGNAWVTAAKQIVSGKVGIDKDAGPSEVVIVADGDAPPELVAADLLAQAEHDPQAMAVLVTPSEDLAHGVAVELERQLEDLATADTARAALSAMGGLLVTPSLEDAFGIAEELAAEHQQLIGSAAASLASRVRNAGAVFVGSTTPTCFGDYVAGPSHVLPTGGTARFSSGLSVLDFTRRSHVVRCSAEAAGSLGRSVAEFARVEGLEGHRRSALLRTSPSSKLSGEVSS